MAFGKKNKNDTSGVNKSKIGEKYNLRISTPHGYFPEDVDKILQKQEELISTLEKETRLLSQKLETAEANFKMADTELRTLRFQQTILEPPETSTDVDMAMLGRLENINPNVGGMPEKVIEDVESKIPLQIIEDKKDIIEEFISPVKNKEPKKEINSDNKKLNNSSALVNGELDII